MPVTLNKCSKDGGEPVEQTRNQMKPEDHHVEYKRHLADPDSAYIKKDSHHVSLEDEHALDVRISCPKCGNSTGWDRRDIERFENKAPGDTRRVSVTRDGNLDNIRKRWNEMNPVGLAGTR